MTELPIAQINLPSGMIDLGLGDPDFGLLPLDLLRRSAEAYFAANDPRPLQYGLEQGNGYFRHALAGFLAQASGRVVDPDLLFITSGASSALDLICNLYTQPGDTILVEEPSYFLALRIFEDHGLRAIPVPMDEDGLRLDALDDLLSEVHTKFIYTIPTFQNPSGRTLSQVRRVGLVERAQRNGFLVVADEVYHFLAYAQAPPEPLAAFVEDVQQIISVNSFSKILAPGLRLGWVHAHPAVIKRLAGSGLLDSGGGMNPFTSALVRGLIESGGLESNIKRLCKEYSRRVNAMQAALRQYLSKAEFTTPQGGFFFWVRLQDVDAVELRREAREYDVDIRQGALFSTRKGLQEYFRLGFCYYGSQAIEAGVKRLGGCVEHMLIL